MTVFYIGALVLISLGLLFAFWPFIHAYLSSQTVPDNDITERQSSNIALYKDHLLELEVSLDKGLIDSQQFEQLKQELEQNLLEDSRYSEKPVAAGDRTIRTGPLVYAAVTILLVPVLALVLYQVLGASMGWQLQQDLQLQSELEQQLRVSGHNPALAEQLNTLNRQ